MNRKTSIAILGTRGLPPKYGGFETIAKHLSKELSLRGFEVYVSCETKLLNPKASEEYYGAKLVYFPIIEAIRNLAEPGLYDMLSIFWASLKTDHILMLGCYFPPSLIVPRLLGRKVFVHVDGLEWKRRKFSRFLRFQLKQFEKVIVKVSNKVLVDSPVIGQYYDQNYSIASLYVPTGVEEIQPFENSSADECLNKFNLSKQDYYLVIARLEPENNIDLILAEFCISNSKKKLAIVGPLKNSDFVRKLLECHDDRVLFLGGIFDPQVQRTLRHNCFVYVHGHEVGGANPSLIEALSCKNVTLAIDCPYNREVAENSAIYFSKTPEDFRLKLEQLEMSPEVIDEKSAIAYSLYRKKYTIGLMIDTMESLFNRLQ